MAVHVLPISGEYSLLAHFALAMMLVVQMGNGFTERLDSSGWSVLATSHRDVDCVWSLKAALDICVASEDAVTNECLNHYRRPPPARLAQGLPILLDRRRSHVRMLAR